MITTIPKSVNSVALCSNLLHTNPSIQHSAAAALGTDPTHMIPELAAMASAIKQDLTVHPPHLDSGIACLLIQAACNHLEHLNTLDPATQQRVMIQCWELYGLLCGWHSTHLPDCDWFFEPVSELMDSLWNALGGVVFPGEIEVQEETVTLTVTIPKACAQDIVSQLSQWMEV